MMELLAWALIGALIGYTAAERQGLPLLAGVLAGAVLGPLALLMFFVNGITKNSRQQKCPHCAEWIKVEATVCKHCGRELAVAKT